MVECSECGFEGCDLAYTGYIGEEQCCDCWQKSGSSDVGECTPCRRRREEKEKILKQQTSLENFI